MGLNQIEVRQVFMAGFWGQFTWVFSNWIFAAALMPWLQASRFMGRKSKPEHPLLGIIKAAVVVFLITVELASPALSEVFDPKPKTTPLQARASEAVKRACHSADRAQCAPAVENIDEADIEVIAAALAYACWQDDDTLACASAGYLNDWGLGIYRYPARALGLYQRACDGGHLVSCTSLGTLYANAQGTARDYAKAISLYTRACEGGDMRGCAVLGAHHEQGMGTAKDYAKANLLYTRACDGGEMWGCSNLGRIYKIGIGVARDYDLAHALFAVACEGGDMLGCANEGVMYVQGFGVRQDLQKAQALLGRACDQGIDQACEFAKKLPPAR